MTTPDSLSPRRSPGGHVRVMSVNSCLVKVGNMPETKTITLSWPESDIGVLTLDLPGKSANILSTAVLEELSAALDEIEARSDVAGVVIVSGKSGTFIAGADIREFAASQDIAQDEVVAMCQRGQSLFARLSSRSFVSIAAIDGICVGGGAELAVWCDRRIVSDNAKTEIGFPEVKLGLYPGWGGTVRTPRIVGLANAVEMITSGDSVTAAEAFASGLASDLVEAEQLVPAAIRMIRDEQSRGQYLKDRQQWSQPIGISETELGFLGATASALIRQQTKDQYPAPMAALEVMIEASLADAQQALQMEAEGMAELFGSPINRALINVFFLTDRNKKDIGVDRGDVTIGSVASIGVIGAGIMGAGITAANIKREVPVVLMDASQEALQRGVSKALEEAAYNKAQRGPDVQKAIQQAPLLNVGTVDAELAGCDLVIEAVVENADIKKKIYRRIEPQLKPDAILASNTSTIPITKLAEQLERPERFCGIHFFNPVRRMKLIEVIRGEKTSDETVATAVAYAKRIGKMPIVVNDGPGFLVNRLLFPYMHAALELLCEGAGIREVDRAARAFGMPMGPITLYDVVGIDTAMYAGRTMWEAFPDRISPSPIVVAMVKSGRLGEKTGRGFFIHPEGKRGRPQPDPEVEQLIEPYIKNRQDFTEEQLTARLFLPMLLEATRLLQDGIVRDVRDIDLGLIFGLGFPPFKGGLLFWADQLSAAKIVEMLEPFEALGARMQPTPLLQEMARQGHTFYGQGAQP